MSDRLIRFGDATDSELRVIELLDKNLPPEYKILTNLRLIERTVERSDLDFDIVVLGQYAVYVLEVKNYYGNISGDAQRWILEERPGKRVIKPSPVLQLGKQNSTLKTLISQQPGMDGVMTQGFVCLSPEERPNTSQVNDDTANIFWYRDAAGYLTDLSKLTFERKWRKDIFDRHERLINLIKTRFTSRKFEIVRDLFEIQEDAWTGRRYQAYIARRIAEPKDKTILKVYTVPPGIGDKEVVNYVLELKGKESTAVRKFGKSEDDNKEGREFVLELRDAFLDSRDSSGRSYIVITDWVKGYPLSYLLNDLTYENKYLIANQICRGLDFIHRSKVAHRNLSLDNILWSVDDAKVKITNFDFAKFISEDDKDSNHPPEIAREIAAELHESKKYQAPELFEIPDEARQKDPTILYHKANALTDLYSLGVVLLEMFTGLINQDKETVQRRLKNASLDKKLREILSAYCSQTPAERGAYSLADAAAVFDSLFNGQTHTEKRMRDLESLHAGDRLGVYEILNQIASTKMSAVYLANDTVTKTPVIIKAPKSALSEDALDELRRARQILEEIKVKECTARLLQYNAVYLLDGRVYLQPVSGAREFYYQVWEYIGGDNLQDFFGVNTVELDDGLAMAIEILEDLSVLHEKKWIHQDVKPSNFIRTPEGHVKVIDFGLSKRASDSAILTGGTPRYMPPEARTDGKWETPGDVWAAAKLILFILFGKKYDPNSSVPVIVDFDEIEEALSAQFAGVFRKALEENPSERYPSAAEFLLEFRSANARWLEDRKGQTKMDANVILSKLKEKQKDAVGTDSEHLIAADVRAIEKWIKDGQTGECPVDLKRYGFLAEAETTAIPSAGEQKPSESQEKREAANPVYVDVEAILAAEGAGQVDMAEIAGVAADHSQETLRLELEKVKKHIEKEEWREAVALAKKIEERADKNLKESARIVLEQAQKGLNNALREFLSRGNAARAANHLDEARKAFQGALALEKENNDARLALMEMGGDVQEQVSGKQLTNLRGGLKERKDILRLGEAVYNAEALDQEGKLPDELIEILKESRAFYDKTRLQMGEETTQMRLGDVTARAKAVEELNKRVRVGEKYIYDATTNSEKPAFELLREAQDLLKQASEDSAQHEINIFEKNKALRPSYVYQRLEKALEQPFYEQDKRKLEEKLAEVSRFIQAQEQAESLQNTALQENDQLKKLALLLQAKEIFKAITGLDEQIDQIRPVAISALQTEMSDSLRTAESLILSQEYKDARHAAMEAEKQASKWPEAQKPEEIVKLLNDARALRRQIDATETAWKEYTKFAKDIRHKVADQDQRAAGLTLYKQVSEDERFKGFPDLRSLTSEIDQYKGVGEQLNDAMSARTAGDWSRVFEIADKVIKANTAGQLAPRFQELYADAVTELNIARAQALLSSDDIFEANSILSATLNKEKERGGQREANLLDRLSDEFKRIQEAVNGRQTMQPLYDQACALLGLFDNVSFKAYVNSAFALRQSRVGADGQVTNPEMRALINQLKATAEEGDPAPSELAERVGKALLTELGRKGIAERFNALRLFRYVGGDRGQAGEAGWPAYALSFRTAEARRAARLVADSMRRDILEPLQRNRLAHLGKESALDDSILREMAEHAAILRDASLLETEEERSVGRWAEVQWGKRQAIGEEKQANWRGAESIWRALDEHHPGVPEVKRGFRNARIQNTINRAHYMVQNDHKGEDALAMLRELQKEADMDNAWELNVALADTHVFLGKFDSAFGNLDQADRIAGSMDELQQTAIRARLQEKRLDLESQRIVYLSTEDARNKALVGNDAEAIRILQAGIENSRIKDATPLRQLRDEIFMRAADALLQKAQVERDRGSDEGKILAITALVDLQTLEDLVRQPAEARRSSTGLNRLRADLGAVAEAVIRAALDFDPSTLPLEQAISRASSISSRLQTFDNVIPLFTAELEPLREKLKKRRADISVMLKNLQELDKVLKQTADNTLWDSAVRSGDFQVMEQYQSSLRKLELNNLPEVRAYDKRLEETRETYEYLLRIINDVKQKFSRDEDFAEVRKIIVESSVQLSYRSNNQAWQAIHVREHEDIRRILDDRLRVPDVYGDSDLVGWQRVLEQAEERNRELELWREWDKQCEYKMDAASQAVAQAELERDAPTRIKKANWEKVRDSAQAALSHLLYSEEAAGPDGIARSISNIGARDAHDKPLASRSQFARQILKEGKRRKELAEQWLNNAEIQIAALDEILERRGFPTEREFADAVAQQDWDRLEKLLERAREAGITDDDERKRVSTYARVLEQKRRSQPKTAPSWWGGNKEKKK